jgi:hypothetical protein
VFCVITILVESALGAAASPFTANEILFAVFQEKLQGMSGKARIAWAERCTVIVDELLFFSGLQNRKTFVLCRP